MIRDVGAAVRVTVFSNEIRFESKIIPKTNAKHDVNRSAGHYQGELLTKPIETVRNQSATGSQAEERPGEDNISSFCTKYILRENRKESDIE